MRGGHSTVVVRAIAVDDLSLEIRDGEFVVIVGPSGGGKTTGLRTVAGPEEVSEGTMRSAIGSADRRGSLRHRARMLTAANLAYQGEG